MPSYPSALSYFISSLPSFNARTPFPRWSLISPPSFSSFMFSMMRYSCNSVSAHRWLIMTRQALNSISVTFVLYREALSMPRDTSCNHVFPTAAFSLPPFLCILLLSDPLTLSGHHISIYYATSNALSLTGAHQFTYAFFNCAALTALKSLDLGFILQSLPYFYILAPTKCWALPSGIWAHLSVILEITQKTQLYFVSMCP